MKIAVSMIARDEEEYIYRAISSVTFADYICLVDFYSEDETLEMARSAVREGVELYTRVEPWPDNFGVARQMALEMIPDDTVWWMRLDADEAYSDAFRRNIRSLLELPMLNGIDAIRIAQTNLVGDTGHYSAGRGGWETHPRIFRHKRSEYEYLIWTGQIHEYVQVMGRDGLLPFSDDVVATFNAPVIHYGWLNRSRRLMRGAQYVEMPGSGFKTATELADRDHVVKMVPVQVPE